MLPLSKAHSGFLLRACCAFMHQLLRKPSFDKYSDVEQLSLVLQPSYLERAETGCLSLSSTGVVIITCGDTFFSLIQIALFQSCIMSWFLTRFQEAMVNTYFFLKSFTSGIFSRKLKKNNSDLFFRS